MTPDLMVWIWVIVLGSSLISILGFARAGSVLFWKAHSIEPPEEDPERAAPALLSYVAVGGLISLLGRPHRLCRTRCTGIPAPSLAIQLFAPEPYISTVVDTPGKLSKPKEDH